MVPTEATESRRRLIVINGSIASGKSTLSRLVGAKLRRRGLAAAVIDLDLVYGMLKDDPKNDPKCWQSAIQTTAAFATALFNRGVSHVAIDGEFSTTESRDLLIGGLNDGSVETTFITLIVSYPEALRRAQADPTRGVSKDPKFLEPHIAEFKKSVAKLPPDEWVVDTGMITANELALRVVKRALNLP